MFEYEEKLRLNQIHLSIEEIEALNVDKYWKQVVCLLNIQNEITYRKKIEKESFNYLLELYQYMIKNKFASFMDE